MGSGLYSTVSLKTPLQLEKRVKRKLEYFSSAINSKKSALSFTIQDEIKINENNKLNKRLRKRLNLKNLTKYLCSL